MKNNFEQNRLKYGNNIKTLFNLIILKSIYFKMSIFDPLKYEMDPIYYKK